MLNSEKSSGGSAVIELVIGIILILGVGFGVYQVQHPEMTQQQRITAAFEQ